MGLETILIKIPWMRLLSALPPLVRTARDLLQASHKNPSAGENLEDRVRRLEANEKIQSELVEKITEQLQGTTESLRILSARLTVLLWMALAALLLSATGLILILRR
jgi:hypothetical protein